MANTEQKIVEGVDYYVEDGKCVFTRAFHLKRGLCCGSGCRHCPYKDGETTCPNCGKGFACTPDGCWCEKVKVPLEALIEMRERFTGCVCPECLHDFAKKAEAGNGECESDEGDR
ncbi:MAG TPA: cysteine-rich CWC family protein [Phycisphaerae bacterium]|jgi:hypothetical protein